ncbi:DUF937 domain-containing protein [Fischerella thermalis]|jgi:hypothetical protein|uniref:DUF937 domain-containing protein n=1 Tax=Fischerella thermalis JSC-11 TaxID=741277 RepID=G6FPF2_9CYAN|nr:DUF937 domain-containing protein [Fischerella thermalis]EHC18752.1 hypothetical protein FJSC11DRAFT_0732 [Fischerella thermalis JSC-11]MBF1988588.1 DUF937 domain-containing protein [Fischerella thermalis M58_A2018_009]MBF2062086.1 DUF937 domain-containing protein [Fischerella thermalis M66_A2018_004]MBF2071678.1 DUF937 domain-containing protein [Fischerella thermalis M48_A2018_028]PLZ11262.1 hypothetical protein CBP19_13060 [Fischerella thermalis WC1110]
MGLFDQIINAIDNPSQQGSTGQLGDIVNTVQQLSNRTGADPSTMQSVIGIVGGYVRSALQQKQAHDGNAEAQAVVNQYGGTSPSPQAVNSLFSLGMQRQVAEAVSQRTGLDAGMIEQLLPVLVPIVLNFLKTGASSQAGGNSVLNSFLDADNDGDVDIADAMQMATRYLGR